MHCVLYFYSFDPSVPKIELARATCSRVSWYERNIELLCRWRSYLECPTPHSRALADPVVRGMFLDDLIARSDIRSSARLVELESRIRSQIYPDFLRVNPRLNSLLLKFLNEFFLSLSRAPWGTGNGVVLTADSLYHFKLLMISVKRRAYLRNNFGRNCSRAGKTTTVRVVACTVYCKGFAVCRLYLVHTRLSV